MPTEAIISAFIALSAAVAAMWVSLKKDHELIVTKQKECEDDREALHDEVSQLRELFGAVKSCTADPCPVHRAFTQK